VSQLAIAAAVDDTRFSPVDAGELKDLRIEISVLSPLEKIKSADDIKPNYHGVVVKKGFRSGLFLPQVWEQIPDKENFMDELCYEKAGLDPKAWKDQDTELYTFTVFAFEE
jgi:AmmeMemoRadiSam system protein A